MVVYADGTALSRFVVDVAESDAWRRWAADHLAELVTTPLGLTEMRKVARGLDATARAVASHLEVRIREERFSDQALKKAAMVSGVLTPFAALHLGVAVSSWDIDAIATYDPLLAATAALHRLDVVSPGRAPQWWEGP